MLKLGLFGGTFNPVHSGHVIMAKQFEVQFQLDKLLIIPAGISYHKPQLIQDIDNLHRIKMCELAFQEIDNVEISLVDITRKGNTYTVDTVNSIKQEFPNSQLWWLLGSDSFKTIHTWHQYQTLIGLLDFVITLREQDSKASIIAYNLSLAIPARIQFLDIPYQQPSSSFIRDKLYRDKKTLEFIPPQVATYILDHQLYKQKG